ncbi:MAG: arsenosugar biosynthesis radical SAM (seleno)protein ArsS [Moraxellaceae bacterium]|nr:arsenosugar biosynthesis radical SAM (seleno)protein ArsS [Moraxellaceae bacterium]MDZ4385708.1 arsenosugar biosynthesis radical SAM (seleno)protein ArsS [Moraxellaceae bacterium]
MHATLPLLEHTDFPQIKRNTLDTLQVNLGYLCNQRCLHCHVNAGPTRKEMMSPENVSLIVDVVRNTGIKVLDLTGGAPEMHQEFRELVTRVRELGVRVIDRCNLTILSEPGYEYLANFLQEQQVEVIASLPCYTADNVDQQRGDGVFQRSIDGLKQLNKLGYGQPDSALILNLVYNPLGATLPPAQAALEARFKRELWEHFGVVFNHLFTITNMPIQRFGSTLISRGEFASYMALLKSHFSAKNLNEVMCRNMVSVDWQGWLYDCDFNQQLGLSLPGNKRLHLKDLLSTSINGNDIRIADHCYGCTAGSGSSCGGSLQKEATT